MRRVTTGTLILLFLSLGCFSEQSAMSNDAVIELLNNCQGNSTFTGQGSLVSSNRQFSDRSTARHVWSNLTKQMTSDVRMTRTYSDNQESKTFAWTQVIKVDGNNLTLTRKTSPDFTERYTGTYDAASKTIRWSMADPARKLNIVLTHDYSQPNRVGITFNMQVDGQAYIRVSGTDLKE